MKRQIAAWMLMLVGTLAQAAVRTGEVSVASGSGGTSEAKVEITGDAAVALYEHLRIEPRVEQNRWSHDVLIKDGPGISCKLDHVQEGIVVRAVYSCALSVTQLGATRR